MTRHDDERVVHRVAGILLDHPDQAVVDLLPALTSAVATLPESSRRCLLPLLDHLAATPLPQLQQEYVALFDMTRKHALHLTYWTDGDTRRRGEVLGAIKSRYRASGWVVDSHGELPDYLPMVLEYAALADHDDGRALLQDYRPSLELLRLALVDARTPYAGVVAAVCDTLPGASPADVAAVHRMAAAGPPREDVGLDPYDPRLLPLATGGAR